MKVATKPKAARLSAPRRPTRSSRASSRSTHASASRSSGKRTRQTGTALAPLRYATAHGRAEQKQPASDPRHEAAVKSFEVAVRNFQKRNYQKSRELFEELANSAPPDVADRARTHLQFCLQRLGLSGISPRTAGEYHVLGVAELNARRLDAAVEHLHKARKLEPRREDIRYVLAAAHALKGESELAIEHLKTAIELRPQNRYQARTDRDFERLARDPRFQSLVFPVFADRLQR